MKVCIVDTESTGIGEGAAVIEIAAVVYDCWARSMVSAWSVTLKTEVVNDAMHINHIPDGIGQVSYAAAMAHLKRLVGMCEHVIAHNAAYDRSVLPELAEASWLCSYADIAWPKSDPKNLAELCLRHGVSMSRAHRAIDDCLGIVSLLDRVGESHDLVELINNAVARRDEPQVTVRAMVDYDTREEAKGAGFKWEGGTRRWLKTVRVSELADLKAACKFQVVNV
jgi:DNA polymerase III epsilon subunit-like protein